MINSQHSNQIVWHTQRWYILWKKEKVEQRKRTQKSHAVSGGVLRRAPFDKVRFEQRLEGGKEVIACTQQEGQGEWHGDREGKTKR